LELSPNKLLNGDNFTYIYTLFISTYAASMHRVSTKLYLVYNGGPTSHTEVHHQWKSSAYSQSIEA